MQQFETSITIETNAKGFYEFTAQAQGWVDSCGIATGIAHLFCRHTSASLTIQENADPSVLRDLADFFDDIAPQDATRYRHASEGLDDMPAHLKTMLSGVSLAIPVSNRRLVLGTWQGIFLCEHRALPQRRHIALHLMGA